MRLLATFALVTAAFGQGILTLTPRNYTSGAVWTAVLCAPPTAAASVATGRIYQILSEHGITSDSYAQAMQDVDNWIARSTPAKIARYAGYAAAVAAFLLTTRVIRARPAWAEGTSIAAGGLNIIVPLASGAEKTQQAAVVKAALLRDGDLLRAAAGECATGVVLGSVGTGFEVVP